MLGEMNTSEIIANLKRSNISIDLTRLDVSINIKGKKYDLEKIPCEKLDAVNGKILIKIPNKFVDEVAENSFNVYLQDGERILKSPTFTYKIIDTLQDGIPGDDIELSYLQAKIVEVQQMGDTIEDLKDKFNKTVANVTNGNENATNTEIVLARGDKTTLGERLDSSEEKISVLNSIKEILKDIDLTGEQDCSEKINEAIAIVERINETDPYSREKGLGAYEIQLPPGKLRIEKPIEIGAHGIIITGCGRHGTILLNRISNTSIATDMDCWNSATIRNKNMYSYKQRILVKDLSIDLGNLGNSERVGIDLTSIGQSNIERVSIFGYDKKGIGFKITSLKNTNDEQVAGHLNTLLNCTAQDVNIGVYINGGSNMNRVVFGEFYNNEIGVKIDNRSISSLTGGANIIECVRLENNNICIDDNSQYTRVLNNYFDGTVSIAINLAEASYFPYLQNNHYSSTVTTKIQKNGTTRSNTITDNYLGQYKGESFEFAGGGKFYGGVGSANVELRDKALKVVNQVTSDAYFSTPGYYRLSTGLDSNPTHRMSLFLDSDLQLCFVDKNGTKRIIAFQ